MMTADTDADARFGQRTYDALCARKRRDALTQRMDYAGIRALEQASRARMLELFEGSDPSVLAYIESGTPGEFAAYLCGVADGYDKGRSVAYMGLIWLALT